MQYGTRVDPAIHQELLARLSTLDMPKVVGFITPMLQNVDGNIVLLQAGNFLGQQLQLHQDYVLSVS